MILIHFSTKVRLLPVKCHRIILNVVRDSRGKIPVTVGEFHF